jgi:hypothetical protein
MLLGKNWFLVGAFFELFKNVWFLQGFRFFKRFIRKPSLNLIILFPINKAFY